MPARNQPATARRTVRKLFAAFAFVLLASTPAAAQNETGVSDNLGCTPPESLSPLMQLLDSLTELALLAGVGLGTIGFMTAAIMIMAPSEDWTRRGKEVFKHVFIGVILLLSAHMVVGYLISQLGGAIC